VSAFTRVIDPPLEVEYTNCGPARSTACPVPSLKPICTQSLLRIPSQCVVALGPIHECASCIPP
jgi:hypothetical protein